MSIAALAQVYDEVRRLAVAGSALAAGDFRLKKLVPPLEKSGEKAPVFAKVAQAVQKLVDAGQNESAAALLELNSLTTAILYTQGETGRAGEFKPIVSSNVGLTIANTSARTLKPLLEALATTGSGRLETIKDAHERGAFKDLRLMKPALKAIDDPYPEIGEFIVEKVLPMYGKPIYDEVKAGFNLKGKGSDGRRLKLLRVLDSEAAHPLVEQALDEGSKDVKLAAIECLGGSSDAIPFLLEQVRGKAKEVRLAALRALLESTDDSAMEVVEKAVLSEDVWPISDTVGGSKSPRLQSFVLKEATRLRDELLGSGNGKPAAKATAKSAKKAPATKAAPAKAAKSAAKKGPDPVDQLRGLVHCLGGRQDPAAVELLVDLFDRRKELAAIKGSDSERLLSDIIARIQQCGSKHALEKLANAWDSIEPGQIHYALSAAIRAYPPDKVYALFGPVYLARTNGKTKSKPTNDANQRSQEIGSAIEQICRYQRYMRLRNNTTEPGFEEDDAFHRNVTLDPQWLDSAITVEDLDTVLELARPNHGGVEKYFAEFIAKGSKGKTKSFDPEYEFGQVLVRMLELKHAGGVEAFLTALRQKWKATSAWYWPRHAAECIAHLPPEALPQVEALLPELHESLQNSVAGALAERRQPAEATG